MVKKKGSFSVDEMLGSYAKRRKEHSEDTYGTREEREVRYAKPDEEEEEPRPTARPPPRRERDEEEYYEKRRPVEFDSGGGEEDEPKQKQMMRNRPLILFTYAFRSFAICIMLFLMLFIVLHDVMKKRPVIDYFSFVGDSFSGFLSEYLGTFMLAFSVVFGLQLAYYLIYRAAKGRWRAHTREEIIYAILFAIVGLICSVVLIWAQKY